MTRKGIAGLALSAALIALAGAALAPETAFSQATTCAVVKLQISQQATLERQAFTADLGISNNLPTTPLTNLKVQITITDSNNNPQTQNFFIVTSTLTGTNAVDGTGVVQSSSSADIQWLIIPSSGTGGISPAGQRYGVSALITAQSGTVPQNIQTFQAFITVNPQPVLKLEYALPFEVFGEEPLLLPNTITPIVPFPLAVRATNIGYGPANNFQIQSAQPTILDNKQDLLVDFQIIGTNVGGQTIPNTLLIPFGNINPNADSQAYWYMTASLSGQFVSFTSTFTHAADLGGQLTSLLQSVNTYTLLSTVLVDLPGRDKIPDFLVNETAARSTMQATLDSGSQPPAQYVLESDQPNPLPVVEVTGSLAGNLSGANAALSYTLTQAVSSNVWVHSYVSWPYGATSTVTYVTRGDGKSLNPANFWISKHFVKSSLQYIYWFNILDLTGSTNTYTVQVNPAGLDLPPAAAVDFKAVTSTAAGSLNLTWTASGQTLASGGQGYLFAGHYFIDAELSTATFSPGEAQVSFATNTPADVAQSYTDSGLIGNVTYYVDLFTQDSGGAMSPLSDVATGYTLPNPPNMLVFSTVTAASIGAYWQIGNNNLPIVYQVELATCPFGAVVSSSPFLDSFHSTFTFTGLSPGTTYFVLGLGINPVTGVAGPPAVLGSTLTVPTRDLLPPRTTLTIGPPVFSTAPIYVSNLSTFTVTAIDDLVTVGDSSGVGVAQTFVSIDTASFAAYTSPFTISAEGLRLVRVYSVDLAGHAELPHGTTVAVDITPPDTTLYYSGASTQDAQGNLVVGPGASFELDSVDPVSNGVASGVQITYYVIDQDPSTCTNNTIDPTQPPGTCANPNYEGLFALSPGTHTAYYWGLDNVNHEETTNATFITVSTTPIGVSVMPSTGPIGIPFTISGSGFGTYNGSNTRVRFGPGGPLAPVSVWNDTTITGSIPGLSTGAYSVAIEVQTGSTVAVQSAGTFLALLPVISTLTPTSGPIGVPFTLSGQHFGPYNGSATQVLIGGATTSLSVWNDSTISGTVPGISSGTYAVVVERATPDGGLMMTSSMTFTIGKASISSITPSTGPIGIPFTISGIGFGPYDGGNTRVRIGHHTAPVSSWADTMIQGTIPGLAVGTYTVVVEIQSGSDVSHSTVGAFGVVAPQAYTLSPSSGPIGISITLTGAGFGPYAGGATTMLVGGATAQLSVWNDTTITGAVPGTLGSGTYPVYAQLTTSDGGSVATSTFPFVVVGPAASSIVPSTGPIGIPFTISGSGFGTYNGSNTRVRIGGLLAPLSSWTNATLQGAIPGLAIGTYTICVEIQSGASVAVSTLGVFGVIAPQAYSLTPSSGPIGVSFTLSGSGFGPYAGNASVVLIGGATAQLSGWNDTTISGAVPGSLTPGTYPLFAQRTTSDGGSVETSTFPFTVMTPFAATLTPSTGPIGLPFTISGSGFGTYNGSNARVRIGALLAPLSVWNNTTISGSIPGLAVGTYTVCIEIQSGSNVAVSTIGVFGVVAPQLLAMTPSVGPIGEPFTLSGASFGPYNGAATSVLFGGTTAQLSAWNDTAISGAVPGISSGTYAVVIERTTPDGGLVISSSAAFTIAKASISSITPSTGPIGIPFTISGSGFGPYDGSNTRVRIGHHTAPVSGWTDTSIQGTIPGLAVGTYTVVVEIQSGSDVSHSTIGAFGVIAPQAYSLTPSSGPIGSPFTLSGAGFGPYNGAATVVLIGGATAQLSVWNDTTITGSIPGLAAGAYPVVAQRTTSDGGLVATSSSAFIVVAPAAAAITPSSATAGTSFTISGSGFGPYNGGNTQVLFSTVAASLSAWNDTTIQGTVPNVAYGTTTVSVEVQSGATVAISTVAFDVVPPNYVFASTDGVVTLNSANSSETVTPISPPTQNNAYAIATSTEENEVIGSFYELSPSGNVFNPPATLQFSFDPANVDTATLSIYTFNGVAWDSSSIVNQQISILSPTQGVITGTLYHASLYSAIHRHKRLRVGILSPTGPGFASEVKGTIPVIGYVNGASATGWTLDYAPGENASFGFTTIASGASAVSSGTLATWNAAGVSGWQTLRLTARNAKGKTASVQESVYVGDPSLLLKLDKGIDKPMGVAVAPSGLIYVADTGNDRIDVFSSGGWLQAMFPTANGRAGLPFTLRSPEAVATDLFSNVYVADTGNKRVVKLTSLGQEMLQIPLQSKPEGIAVDAAGNIYVSDTGNAQVLKFSPVGSRLETFALPQSKPMGLALDAAGRLYVVDSKKRRIAVFSPAGTLVETFGPGLGLDHPFGVAVTAAGEAIVVSDLSKDKVLSLDALGTPTISFGGPLSGLSGPRGLALDAEGALYVTERPVGKVLKVGPPPPGTLLVPFADKLSIVQEADAFFDTTGGELRRADGAAVIIPPGALQVETEVTLSTPLAQIPQIQAMWDDKLTKAGFVSVSTGVVVGPDGTALTAAATIIVPYDPKIVAAAGLPEMGLRIVWWNPDRQEWRWVQSHVDPATHTVRGQATRFAIFRVVGRKDGL